MINTKIGISFYGNTMIVMRPSTRTYPIIVNVREAFAEKAAEIELRQKEINISIRTGFKCIY